MTDEQQQGCAHLAESPVQDDEALRWLIDCPEDLSNVVVTPVRFERHVDRSVPALRVFGFDRDQRRCYYRHQYEVHDERFDEDDLPMRVETYREQVTAWRLPGERWIRLVWRISGFPGCGRKVDRSLVIVDSSAEAFR